MNEIKGELSIVLDWCTCCYKLKDSGWTSKDEYNLVDEDGVTVAQCDTEEHAIAIRDRWNEHPKLVERIKALIECLDDSEYERMTQKKYALEFLNSLTPQSGATARS
jgi:hypothetical protein